MACKLGLIFFVLTLVIGVCSASSADVYEYCVVGAGPGGIEIFSNMSLRFCTIIFPLNESVRLSGLQVAYYLEKANRNYIVFERGSSAGKKVESTTLSPTYEFE